MTDSSHLHLRPARPDEPLCSQAAGLLNSIYTVTEHPIWRDGHLRTSTAEMQESAAAGDLLVALDGSTLLGCVVVHVDGASAGFGPLAVAPTAGGRGVGTVLVRAAERLAAERGATRMEIEVLRPAVRSADTAEADATRARLSSWYPSLGYRFAGTVELGAKFPELVPDLACAAVLDLYERPLAEA